MWPSPAVQSTLCTCERLFLPTGAAARGGQGDHPLSPQPPRDRAFLPFHTSTRGCSTAGAQHCCALQGTAGHTSLQVKPPRGEGSGTPLQNLLHAKEHKSHRQPGLSPQRVLTLPGMKKLLSSCWNSATQVLSCFVSSPTSTCEQASPAEP